jgi:hypothetical protein
VDCEGSPREITSWGRKKGAQLEAINGYLRSPELQIRHQNLHKWHAISIYSDYLVVRYERSAGFALRTVNSLPQKNKRKEEA